MGFLFTVPMGFLFTATLAFLFTMTLGFQLTISNNTGRTRSPFALAPSQGRG
jgi:hypothetical protein